MSNIIEDIYSQIKRDKDIEIATYLAALEKAKEISYETSLDVADDIYNWYYSRN